MNINSRTEVENQFSELLFTLVRRTHHTTNYDVLYLPGNRKAYTNSKNNKTYKLRTSSI